MEHQEEKSPAKDPETDSANLTGVTPGKDWELDHIAHIVLNLDSAIAMYTSTLGFSLEARELLEPHQVELAFVRGAGSRIELIMPLAGNKALEKFLGKRGEGLHHIAFRVRHLQSTLQELASAGVELIDKSPRLGAERCQVAFLHPRSFRGLLLELVER